MVVYAKVDGTIIWSSVRANHKQGRVSANRALAVIDDSGKYYELDPVINGSLDRDVDITRYPNFYVARADVAFQPYVEEPPVDPPPSPPFGLVSDEQAAVAIVTLLKWLKQ